MKNRKTVLIAFLLAAVMVIGVGYAAFSDTLTLIGNTVIDIKQAESNYEEKVYFASAAYDDAASTSTGDRTKDTVGGIDTDDATYSIHSLATKGEKRVVKFVIQNDSNVPVQITIPENKLSGGANNSNSNPTYFSVDYQYDIEDKVIPANGGQLTITVTVSVIDAITVETGATFGIEYTATTVNDDEVPSENS